MNDEVALFDVVALVADMPSRGLRRGQVGTVIELLEPGVFEVEFSDDDGRTYATAPLHGSQLMVLHDEEFLRRIARARRDIREGRFIPLDDLPD